MQTRRRSPQRLGGPTVSSSTSDATRAPGQDAVVRMPGGLPLVSSHAVRPRPYTVVWSVPSTSRYGTGKRGLSPTLTTTRLPSSTRPAAQTVVPCPPTRHSRPPGPRSPVGRPYRCFKFVKRSSGEGGLAECGRRPLRRSRLQRPRHAVRDHCKSVARCNGVFVVVAPRPMSVRRPSSTASSLPPLSVQCQWATLTGLDANRRRARSRARRRCTASTSTCLSQASKLPVRRIRRSARSRQGATRLSQCGSIRLASRN